MSLENHVHDEHHIACDACDQLLHVPPLAQEQEAVCQRCGHVIAGHSEKDHGRIIGLLFAALIFLGCALYFPMLGFSASGRSRGMTLLDSGLALLESNETVLGILVIGLIVGLPLLLVVVMLVVLLSLQFNWLTGLLPFWGRIFYEVRHWNMVEVYVLGVLVSLTKIASMAEIEFGMAFWALIAFSVCFLVALNSVDRIELWRLIREARKP
ncbi:MAG: paraquat-inducible protein A [Cellvibrionaceae bacterium]